MAWIESFSPAARVLAACASAFALTYVATPLVRISAVRLGLVSRPTHDRWGRRAIARLGGAALFFGVVASALAWAGGKELWGVLAAASLVFLLGLWDDLRRMRPYTKLIGQILVGCFAVLAGIRFDLPDFAWAAIPLSVLWLVFIMNAFNLLDNMDGLAAGVGGIAGFFCTMQSALVGQWSMAVVSAALTGACLAFLRYNFSPARIFMGDSGSHLLGFCLGASALVGTQRQAYN